MSEWIARKDQEPAEDGAYLIFAPSGDPDKPLIAMAWYNPDAGWAGLLDTWLAALTHWMPLPEPPKV